jgi:type I restriction enzyme M protein
MDTILGDETEKEVEVRLLHPLFRDILGYPERDLAWNKPVKITFGHEVKTKQADLVVSHNSDPVIAVEAKKPTETVTSGVSQVDSYAFALKTRYSVITNGKHLVLRGYYAANSRFNVIDDTVEGLRRSNWDKLINLISFKNIISSVNEPAHPVASPDEDQIKNYRRFFRMIHNAIRDREKLDPGNAFDELSKLLFLKAAEDERSRAGKSPLVLTPDRIAEWESMGEGMDLANRWFEKAIAELFPGIFEEHPRIELKPGTLKEVLGMMKTFHVKNGDVDVKGRAFEGRGSGNSSPQGRSSTSCPKWRGYRSTTL